MADQGRDSAPLAQVLFQSYNNEQRNHGELAVKETIGYREHRQTNNTGNVQRRRIRPISIHNYEKSKNEEARQFQSSINEGSSSNSIPPGWNNTTQLHLGANKEEHTQKHHNPPSSSKQKPPRFNETAFYFKLAKQVELSSRRYVNEVRREARRLGRRPYSGYDDGEGFIDDSELLFHNHEANCLDSVFNEMQKIEDPVQRSPNTSDSANKQVGDGHDEIDKHVRRSYDSVDFDERKNSCDEEDGATTDVAEQRQKSWKAFTNGLIKLPEAVAHAVKKLRDRMQQSAMMISQGNGENEDRLASLERFQTEVADLVELCSRPSHKLIHLKSPSSQNAISQSKEQQEHGGVRGAMDGEEHSNDDSVVNNASRLKIPNGSSSSRRFKILNQRRSALVIEKSLWATLRTFLPRKKRLQVQRVFHSIFWTRTYEQRLNHSAHLMHQLRLKLADRIMRKTQQEGNDDGQQQQQQQVPFMSSSSSSSSSSFRSTGSGTTNVKTQSIFKAIDSGKFNTEALLRLLEQQGLGRAAAAAASENRQPKRAPVGSSVPAASSIAENNKTATNSSLTFNRPPLPFRSKRVVFKVDIDEGICDSVFSLVRAKIAVHRALVHLKQTKKLKNRRALVPYYAKKAALMLSSEEVSRTPRQVVKNVATELKAFRVPVNAVELFGAYTKGRDRTRELFKNISVSRREIARDRKAKKRQAKERKEEIKKAKIEELINRRMQEAAAEHQRQLRKEREDFHRKVNQTHRAIKTHARHLVRLAKTVKKLERFGRKEGYISDPLLPWTRILCKFARNR
eukprot:jgi/Bigna1/68997/fgenesh1_pg.7_\